MYLRFYNLQEYPFLLNPESRFLFACNNRKDILLHLLDDFDKGKELIAVIGERGTGKTTLLKALGELLPENAVQIFLSHSRVEQDKIQYFSKMLKFPVLPSNESEFLQKFRDLLLSMKAKRQRLLLILDDFHRFSKDFFAFLLDMLWWPAKDLGNVTLILAGEPDSKQSKTLRTILKQHNSDLVSLENLSREDTEYYINYRLYLAGWYATRPSIFSEDAIDKIYEYSSGNPRKINIICNNALVFGAILKQKPIFSDLIGRVRSDDVCRNELKNLLKERKTAEAFTVSTVAKESSTTTKKRKHSVKQETGIADHVDDSSEHWTGSDRKSSLTERKTSPQRPRPRHRIAKLSTNIQVEEDLWHFIENIQPTLKKQNIRILGITSPVPGQGNSTLAFHLSKMMVRLPSETSGNQEKSGVLLVDANPWHEAPWSTLLSDSDSLLAVLNGRIEIRDAILPMEGGYDLLPFGRSRDFTFDPVWIQNFSSTLTRLLDDYDYIVVDLPAVLRAGLVSLLCSVCDAVVVLASARRCNWNDVSKAREKLYRSGVNVLGGILNRKKDIIPGWLKKWT